MPSNFKANLFKAFHLLNPWSLVSFTQRINNYVGLKFTLMLSSNYYVTKGFAHMLIRSCAAPWFKQAGLNSFQNELNSTIAMMPWSLKGFFAILSDNFALGGYSKTVYLILLTIIASFGSIALVVIPDSSLFLIPQLPAFLMFAIHSQASAADLFCEGKYVEKMKQIPETRGDLITYVWFCQMFGAFWPHLFVGPYADLYNPKWLIILMIPLIIQMLPFLCYGCMVNDRVNDQLKNKWNTRKFRSQWKIMTLGILVGFCTVILSLLSFAPYGIATLISLILSLVICIAVWGSMPRVIGGSVIYLFLTTALSGGDGGATLYWVLADEDCVPGGPKFDYTFLLTYSSMVSSFFQLIGLLLFQIFIVKMEIRKMFWFTSTLQLITSCIGMLFYTRTNLALGISDKFFYLITGSVFSTTFYIMNFMPSALLIAKVCPREVEVTVYSVLASCSNFGLSIATYYGIYLAEIFNIQSLHPCNFDNLILLIGITGIFLPALEIPCCFFLIPKGMVDDDLLGETRLSTPSVYSTITQPQALTQLKTLYQSENKIQDQTQIQSSTQYQHQTQMQPSTQIIRITISVKTG